MRFPRRQLTTRYRQLGIMRLMPSVGAWGRRRVMVVLTTRDDFTLFTHLGSPGAALLVTVVIPAAVVIGSTSNLTAGFIFGAGWHADTRFVVVQEAGAIVCGKAGDGAQGEGANGATPIPGVAPTDGGPALDASGLPTTGMLEYYNFGIIGAGGGAGGFGGGGAIPPNTNWGGGGGGPGRGTNGAIGVGGAAINYPTGLPGKNSSASSASAPGTGGLGGNHPSFVDTGGDGGDFGQPGTHGKANGANYGAPSNPGVATIGDAKINFVELGTIMGSRT